MALTLLGEVVVLLSQPNYLNLKFLFLISQLSYLVGQLLNLPAVLVGDVRKQLLHLFAFLFFRIR